MRLLFLIFMAVVITACGAAPESLPTEQLVQATPEIYLVQATELSSSTPTPSLVATPTIDYQAKIGQAGLELQLSLGTATMAAVTAQVIETADAKLAAKRYATSTVTVQAGQTDEARIKATDDYLATGTVEAPLIAREWTRTQWEPAIQGAICGGILLIAFSICWAVLALANARHAAMMAASKPIAAKSGDHLSVTLDMRDAYGWGSVDWSTLPIDRETLENVAQMLTDGLHYTERHMTGSGKPLIKDSTFDSFGKWMVLNRIATQISDGRYVIQHLEFFKQVLA